MLVIPVLIIISLLGGSSSQTISITPTLSVTTINTNSIYSFSIIDGNLSTKSGNIIIGFPSTLYSLSSVSCYNTDTLVAYTCSIVSSVYVLVVYTLPTYPSSIITISISTIKNPPSVQTLTFTYVLTNLTAATATASSTYSSLTPDVLSSCSVSFTPSTAYTEAVISFSITTKNAIGSSGGILVTFPSNWVGYATSTDTIFMYSSSTCAVVSGSSFNSTLSCSVLSSVYLSILPAFSSAVTSSSILKWTASGIRTPPTTSPSNTLTITTQSPQGYSIDQSTCTITAVTQKSITISSSDQFTVGVAKSLSISWTSGSPLKVADIIIITLPSTYMAWYSYDGGLIRYGSAYYTGRTIAYGTSSFQLKLTITTLPSGTYIASGTLIQVLGLVAYCYIDTSPRTITVQISRGGYYVQSGTLILTPIANALASSSIASDVTLISSTGTYTIKITTTNILLSTSQLQIQFPTEFTLTGTAPTCTVASTTSPSATLSSVTCTLSSKTITIPTFLQSSLPAASSLTITVAYSFYNPDTSQPSSVFIIGTYSAASYVIDKSSSLTFTATPATISSFTITPTSYVVGASTIYTFVYTLSRALKSGTTIIITLPSQLSLASSPSYTYTINSSTYSSTTPTLSNSTLTFSSIITSLLPISSTITIKISTITNPPSTKTSSTFTVYTQYNSYTIQSLTSGLTATMTTLAAFKELVPLVASPMNGATKDYTFYFKVNIVMAASSYLVLTIVDNTSGFNQLTFISSISYCPIYYSASTLINNTCTVSGSTLTILLSSALTDTTIQYRLIVSSFVLARTPATSSLLKLTSYTPAGYGVQSSTVPSLTNTQPNYILSIVLTILTTPSQLNSYQQLKLVIKFTNGLYLQYSQYLIVQIPSVFTYSASSSITSICTNTNIVCTFYNSDYNMLKIMKSSTYSNSTGLIYTLTITLDPYLYISPYSYDYTTSYFYVSTYTNASLLIDITSPTLYSAALATFYRTCSGKCKTCLDSNLSYCLSCYQYNDGVLSGYSYGGYNTMTSDNQCVDVCGDGYYNSSNTCIACVTPCVKCTSSTQCTSCYSGYYYLASAVSTARCISECPSGYYQDTTNLVCAACSSSCYNCTASSSTSCTACASSLYLSASATCVSECPSGYYQNSTLNKCVACDAGCLLTCNNNATDCDSCKSGYIKLSSTSSECVNTCPTGSVNDTTTNVCGCSSSCSTCSGTLTNCTSCSSPLILYKYTCISACPSQTYYSTSSLTCLTCTDSHCSQCTSASCTQCSTSYYLYSGTCLSQCVSGTRIQNYTCVLCDTGCSVCLSDSICTQCFSGYLIQGSQCVLACSTGYINFNATSCVSECPTGYYNKSNKCQLNTDTDNSTTTTTTTTTTSSWGKIVPFPFTISYIFILGLVVAFRCLYHDTILVSLLMSLGSLLEIFSIVTLVVVAYISLQKFNVGIVILVIALLLIYLCNIVNVILIAKVLQNDNKFNLTSKKVKSAHLTIRIISTLTYHKFHEIVFSNVLGARVFCSKVDYVHRLYPFNILLIISCVISGVVVVGSAILSYQFQQYSLGSSTFIQSIDAIVVILMNLIPTALVLRRQSVLYEKYVNEDEIMEVKRYETTDQLELHNDSGNIQEIIIDQSNLPKLATGLTRNKNYFYDNQEKRSEQFDTPLDRKRGKHNSMLTMSNSNGNGGNFNNLNEISSEALVSQSKIREKRRGSGVQDLDLIILEENQGDTAANPYANANTNTNVNNKNNLNNLKNNNNKDAMTNYVGYDLDPSLLLLPETSEQFKKLPNQLKARIRLAKANQQINRNSIINIKDNSEGEQDMEQIKLSPKNKKRDQSIIGSGSALLGPEDSNLQSNNNSNIINNQSESNSKLLNNNNNNQKDDKKQGNTSIVNNKGPSSSKSRDQSKKYSIKSQDINNIDEAEEGDDNQMQENGKNKNKNSKKDIEHQARMVRNRSEQISKKQSVNALKSTKSQNIKKKKKKHDQDIMVMYNDATANNQNNQDKDNQSYEQYEYEQDEPRLPTFKHRNQTTKIHSKSKQKNQNQKQQLSQSNSMIMDDFNLNNLREGRGQRPIPRQNPDDLPHLHSSSEQIGKLVNNMNNINQQNRRKNKNKNNRSEQGQLDYSNDDSSIYRKIYNNNDDNETLKSAQGDNLYGHQVSPSMFNAQNQRFQDTDTSHQAPVPATIQLDSDGNQIDQKFKRNNRDGFEQNYQMRRYGSNNNIDYDSVLNKKVKNDRLKQLQEIYLRRLTYPKKGRK